MFIFVKRKRYSSLIVCLFDSNLEFQTTKVVLEHIESRKSQKVGAIFDVLIQCVCSGQKVTSLMNAIRQNPSTVEVSVIGTKDTDPKGQHYVCITLLLWCFRKSPFALFSILCFIAFISVITDRFVVVVPLLFFLFSLSSAHRKSAFIRVWEISAISIMTCTRTFIVDTDRCCYNSFVFYRTMASQGSKIRIV